MSDILIDANYSVKVLSCEKYLQFDILIYFSHPISQINFLLNEEFELNEYPSNIDLKREENIIYVEMQELTSFHISYRCYKLSRLFLQGTFWLLTPDVRYKVTNLSFVVDQNCYFGNYNKNFLECYDLNRITLYFMEEQEVLIHCHNDNIIIKNLDLPSSLNIHEEFVRFIEYYKNLMQEDLEFDVAVCDNIPANCISMRNLILCKTKMITYNSSFLYQYMFHEIIHQVVGNELLFTGKGYLWLRESLTEYMQILYLKLRFGEKMFANRIEFYKRRYEEYKAYEEIIREVDDNSNFKTFLATIASKGVLLTYVLFKDVDLRNLEKVISKLKNMKKYITIEDFFDVLDKKLYRSKEQVFYYLNNIGLPSVI